MPMLPRMRYPTVLQPAQNIKIVRLLNLRVINGSKIMFGVAAKPVIIVRPPKIARPVTTSTSPSSVTAYLNLPIYSESISTTVRQQPRMSASVKTISGLFLTTIFKPSIKPTFSLFSLVTISLSLTLNRHMTSASPTAA